MLVGRSIERPASGPEESPTEATVLRMLPGTRLRRLHPRSEISRMETGRIGLKSRDVEDLLTDWFETYLAFEPAAATMCNSRTS